MNKINSNIYHLLANMKINYISKNSYFDIKKNKIVFKLLSFLKKKGYIINFKKNQSRNKYVVFLKYIDNKPLVLETLLYKNQINTNFKKMQLISKKNPYVIITNSKGLMFAYEACKLKRGGQLLFEFKI